MEYSVSFKQIVEDPIKVRLLLEGCQAYGIDYEKWKEFRFFIVNEIDKPGTIIDIGCANGFLLHCLQEWSDLRLIPYGIDKNAELVQQAKALFSDIPHNFRHCSVEDFCGKKIDYFPSEFNYIYWNFPNRWKPQAKKYVFEQLRTHMSKKGKFIIGLYGTNDINLNEKQLYEEKLKLFERALVFKRLSPHRTIIRSNPYGSSHILVIFRNN